LSILLTVVIAVAYPLVVWLGEGEVEPRMIAAFLAVAFLTRLRALNLGRTARWWLIGTLALLIVAIFANALLPLKLYPVAVNAALLATFAYSLVVPPSMIERFARLTDPHLPEAAIGYTRQVTQVWCVFFALNGAIAFATAVWASARIWWFYNGFIAYILMGVLFAGEYCVRSRFRRRHYA
jgi:uncharacterized membrane protein